MAQRTTDVLGVPLVAAAVVGDRYTPTASDVDCVRRGQLLAMKPSAYAIAGNVIYNIRRDGIEQAVFECRANDDGFGVNTQVAFDLPGLQEMLADAGMVLFSGDMAAIRRAVGDCHKNVKPGGTGNIRWERADEKVWINCHTMTGPGGYFKVNIRPADGKTARSYAPAARGTACSSFTATAGKALGGDGQSTSFEGTCVRVNVICGTANQHDSISITTTCPSPSTAVRSGIVTSLQVATGHKGPQVKSFVDTCLSAAASRRPLPDDKEVGKDGLLTCISAGSPGRIDLQGLRQ